jgi:hypothetical protein
MVEAVRRSNAVLAWPCRGERELGRGGKAVVHPGWDRSLEEIEVPVGIRHPNVLPLDDSAEAGGFLRYVTPPEHGETTRRGA